MDEIPTFRELDWMADARAVTGLVPIEFEDIPQCTIRAARKEIPTVGPTNNTSWFGMTEGADVGIVALIRSGKVWRMKAGWIAPEWRGLGYATAQHLHLIDEVAKRGGGIVEGLVREWYVPHFLRMGWVDCGVVGRRDIHRVRVYVEGV